MSIGYCFAISKTIQYLIMRPKLSVAMCTYNGERFLTEQLLSIVNQELPVDEIIICDDGSTDETINLINNFKQKYNDLAIDIFVNRPQLGVVHNFEKAISKCSGDIIFLSDQDDIWAKDKTKTITDYFQNHDNIDLVFTDAILIDKDGNNLSRFSLLDAVGLYGKCLTAWENGMALEMINRQNRCTGATMALKKSLKNKVLPFCKETTALHDEQLAVIGIKKRSLAVIKQPLINYRLHENNTIGIGNKYRLAPNLHHNYSDIFKPYKVKKWICDINEDLDREKCKIHFMQYRYKHSSTLHGKTKILLNLHLYIKNYKRYFFHCFITDLIYGINNYFSRVVHVNI